MRIRPVPSMKSRAIIHASGMMTSLLIIEKRPKIHRQVRQYAQRELIKPGATLSSIAEEIDDGVRALLGHPGT